MLAMPEQTTLEQSGHLQRRRITLPDGRYLIFYTFGDESQSSSFSSADRDAANLQADAKPFAAEESGV